MRIDPLLTSSPATGAIRHVTGQLLRDTYLVPRHQGFPVAEVLPQSVGPWSESYQAAPQETVREVEAALISVAASTRSLIPEDVAAENLPESRAQSHLVALRSVWAEINGALPEDLEAIRHVLYASPADALEPLPLLENAECVFATQAERCLAAKLNEHHGTAPETAVESWRARRASVGGAASGALAHVQAHLTAAIKTTTLDPTISIYGLRDPIEEAEFAAARAQRLLDDQTVNHPQEIGLLVSDDAFYSRHLARAFEALGIPLAGLPEAEASRDPVGELLSAFLAIVGGPAPRTALATFYTSSLMPWPQEIGAEMARETIERGYSRTARDYGGAGKAILGELGSVSSAAQLGARLSSLEKELSPDTRLRPRIGELRGSLSDDSIDWSALRRIAMPRGAPASGHARFVEGVSFFGETALPWRPVRQLIVLGLAGRSWPRPAAANPFFTEGEIAMIAARTGLELPSRARILNRRLELFRRQLCAATEATTLLVPARDMSGLRLPASTGLSLIARAVGVKDPETLVTDLRGIDPAKWPTSLRPNAAIAIGGAPDLPDEGLVDLGTDLLHLREDDKGRAAPQSPSRLETMIVSPLAWLLDELGARDRPWVPETLDVLTLGTLIHHVLEVIFPANHPVSDDANIEASISSAVAAAIRRYAPWLNGEPWKTERLSLTREARAVSLSWARFLRGANAEIIANEISLSGDSDGLPIAGRADCLLRLPDCRLMVVDHKRSSSGPRRERMRKGWDLQVALYRRMLERPDRETGMTRAMLGDARPVTAYHLTRDAAVLTDADGAGIPGAEPASQDASEAALACLADLITQARNGIIALGRVSDQAKMKKERGITAYALKDNAFLAAFSLPDEYEETDDAW